MEGNSTASSHVTSTVSGQQASGRSVFWALATIVTGAMLQPSFAGQYWSRETFRDLFWPHRSSPSVCLVDGVADIWIMYDQRLNPEKYRSDGNKRAEPTTVVMRLVIFVLGVMPQAIKLFSMRGIPVTQALAATFLVPLIANMTRALYLQAPYDGLG